MRRWFGFTLRNLCVFVVGFHAQIAIAQRPTPAPDRNAFTFTKYNLSLTIEPDTAMLTARGTVTLRNDSDKPQSLVAMQLGSQLKWASIKLAANPVPFDTAKLDSDIDHTGAIVEATFTLPQPLAPKATIDVEVGYSGNITKNTSRLTRVGVPADQANASDWDRISPDFTALRGVGHIVWYPVALEPALLSERNKLFVELGAFRARHQDSSMKLDFGRFASEHVRLQVLSNGAGGIERLGAYESTVANFTKLGLDGPLLILGKFEPLTSPNALIYAQAKQSVLAARYADAAKKVAPEVTSWLRAPQQPITVIQHPDANAAPFESGNLLLTPFIDNDRAIQWQLAHTLAHAAVPSSRAWIAEGLAHYAQLREKEVQDGRKAALEFLFNRRATLALDEPENMKASSESAARSLINTGDEVLYRTKAMYVWWMLHEMLGDEPILKALRNYRDADDKEPLYMERLIEAQAHRDLTWFFSDWVYRDHGLPDFGVAQVYPRETISTDRAKGYLITVTVENLGDCGAEIPVRVLTKDGDYSVRLEVMGNSRASARVSAGSLPLEVILNDGSVPESDLTNNVWKAEEQLPPLSFPKS